MNKEIYNKEEIIREVINRKIGFLGIGQMGGSLLQSFTKFLNSTGNNKNMFYLYDTNQNQLNEYKSYGFNNIAESEKDIFSSSRIIFICTKPDTVETLLRNNIEYITKEHLLVSIAAGISIDFIESIFKFSQDKSNTNTNGLTFIPKIIRIMTNHLCLINEASSVYAVNKHSSLTDENIIKALLNNVGIITKIQEKQMNVFTALAGSGPAFVYHFAESLIDGALKNGIDIHAAREYVIQTLYGAAKYLRDNKSNNPNPNNIKYIVTTPNGTTIAGLTQLDKYKFKYAVNEAITSATKRGAEIEKEKMKLFSKSKF